MHKCTPNRLHFLKQTALFFFFLHLSESVQLVESVCRTHPQKTQITICPQNEVTTSIRLVNSPHSAGSMFSHELEPLKVQPRLLHPSAGKVSIFSSYDIYRRVLQGSDQWPIHPSILLLTVTIGGCLRIECRKQGSYREVSRPGLPASSCC